MLPVEELKHRIAAARMLRGVKQADLEATLAAEGLGSRELGRIERGDLPLTRIRREVLARALRVPEDWFMSEDVDGLVGLRETDERLERIERTLAQVLQLAEFSQAAIAAGFPESLPTREARRGSRTGGAANG